MNPRNAKLISPAVIKEIGIPLKISGKGDISRRSLIEAKSIMTKAYPDEIPIEKTRFWTKESL